MVTRTLAYSFKPGEAIHAGVRRIAAEELDSAVDHLEGRGHSDVDEAIHEARKNLKKIRGLLRLMRAELGITYTRDNQRLRNAGQKLSTLRDAGAMLEIFDQLSNRSREDWAGRDGMASIRSRLVDVKAAHHSLAGVADVLAAVGEELRPVREGVKDWPLRNDGFNALAPGLELTYRNGRRAMEAALREPSGENFHNWRKRVKDHWYHVRLIGRVCGDALTFYQKTLKDLESYLGDDHNLTVLRPRISGDSGAFGSEEDVSLFLSTIESYQSSLRSSAVLLGQDVYQDRPKRLVRQLRSLWEERVKDRDRINSSLPVTGLSGCET